MSIYVVTGAARGLGFELTKQLSELPTSQVAQIFAIIRSDAPSALQELVSKGDGGPDRIVTVQATLTDLASLEAAAETIKSRSGSGSIDVLINNAGKTALSEDNTIASFAPEAMNDLFDTNVTGTHRAIRAFLPLLRAGRGKKIINISSSMGSIGWADRFAVAPAQAYKITKTALNMLNKQYAIMLEKEGFTVLAISPGWLKTDFTQGMGDFTPGVGARCVIEQTIKADQTVNGKFFNIHVPGHESDWNQYDGKEIPW